MLTYIPILLDDQAAYLKLLAQCPMEASDYSFVNLWAWADAYQLEWAWDGDLVWIRQRKPRFRNWAPVGLWSGVDWQSVLSQPEISETTFARVPETLLNAWQNALPGQVRYSEKRDDWDYIYDMLSLINLSGNRFHKKKNLVKQFQKRYNYTFAPLTAESVEAVLKMQKDWCEWRDCESMLTLSAENRAIRRILTCWDRLSTISGGVLYVDERLAAYTVGEVFSPNMLIIHFEKGDPSFKGVYQAVNQYYLASRPQVASYVNREQDLGDPGLRKSKLSYHPEYFIKKYEVSVDV